MRRCFFTELEHVFGIIGDPQTTYPSKLREHWQHKHPDLRDRIFQVRVAQRAIPISKFIPRTGNTDFAQADDQNTEIQN